MPARTKRLWSDPNREGRERGRRSARYCARCGNTVQQFRILKSLNLCEPCVKELAAKRDGVNSCRGCGKLAPQEIREHGGYCNQCICIACGRPDPVNVRKTGMCAKCSSALGDFCRICGKEASAQVRKNKGVCDACKTGLSRLKRT